MCHIFSTHDNPLGFLSDAFCRKQNFLLFFLFLIYKKLYFLKPSNVLRIELTDQLIAFHNRNKTLSFLLCLCSLIQILPFILAYTYMPSLSLFPYYVTAMLYVYHICSIPKRDHVLRQPCSHQIY